MVLVYSIHVLRSRFPEGFVLLRAKFRKMTGYDYSRIIYTDLMLELLPVAEYMYNNPQ